MKNSVKPERADALFDSVVPPDRSLQALDLPFGDVVVRVLSNSGALLLRLDRYYQSFLGSERRAPDIVVHAIDRAPSRLALPFREWPREVGKAGRKEEWAEIDGGRVVRKVRTGMQFLVGGSYRLAFGPCREHDNQIVNFINTQLINHHLHQGWVLGHAAAVARGEGEPALAIAARSGGGKSTLALHLLTRGAHFMSNDRVLFRRDPTGLRIRGVPKLPRVNPGTILHNPQLHSLLSPQRLKSLGEIGRDELWRLEEKYDVDLRLTFGGVRYVHEAPLRALLVLEWDRHRDLPPHFEEIPFRQSESAFVGVRKGPGPFYVDAEGRMPGGPIEPDRAAYEPVLADLPTVLVGGGVGFEAAVDHAARTLELTAG